MEKQLTKAELQASVQELNRQCQLMSDSMVEANRCRIRAEQEANKAKSELADYKGRNARVRFLIEAFLQSKYQTTVRTQYTYNSDGSEGTPIEVCEEARILRVIHGATFSGDDVPF